MKNIKIFSLALGAAVLSTGAYGQTASPDDLLKLSQYNYSFSTARSAALGGAMTALGADLSSMAINPAGLGMYKSSDIGFSPSVTTSKMTTNYGGYAGSADGRTRFAIGNLAAAFNVYQGSGSLTSMTLGVGYSKLADFNNSSFAYNRGIENSISEVFAERMNGVPVSVFKGDDPYKPFRQDLAIYQWGGGLAYQTKLLEAVDNTHYSPFGPPVGTGPLSELATMNPEMRRTTTGSVGEYDISAGFNFQNIFYFGFTVGIQDIYLRNVNDYSETYNNNAYNLEYMNYIQQQRMDGTGVNVKIGAIVRPTPNLRIGVAVHTPTFISTQEEYIEYLGAKYKGTAYQGLADSPFAVNNYNLSTPTRFMTGISYSQPGIGLISFDYERVWYNGMRMKNTGSWSTEETFQNDVKYAFKAANNFRVGLELTPTKNFYLRAGYASYGSSTTYNDIVSPNYPTIKSYMNYSGGLGYRFGTVYLDLAYIYTDYKYLQSDLFYFEDINQKFVIDSGTVDYKLNRNTVTMTLGFRF